MTGEKGYTKNKERLGLNNRHIAVSIFIMVLVAVIIIALFQVMYNSSKENVLNAWGKNIIQLARSTEYYIARPVDFIDVSSTQVERMMDADSTNQEIREYLISEKNQYASLVDNNYTGVYGYCRGEYLDASGWVPDSDYDPTKRPWYTEAKNAGGEVALVSPFLNLQTNTMMMSISKLLSDGESVLSIDIYMNGLQNTLRELTLQDGVKLAFIMDNEGTVVAHPETGEIGKNYLTGNKGYYQRLAEQAFSVADDDRYFTTGFVDAEVVYAERVNSEWCAVIVINETKLLSSAQYINLALVAVLTLALLSWYFVITSINRKYKEAEKLSREVSAVADIYEVMILIDLKSDKMEVLRGNQLYDDLLQGNMTAYSMRIAGLAGNIASDGYRDMLVQFMDPAQYEERLRDAHSVSYDFVDSRGLWTRIQLIVVDRDNSGHLWHIIWAVESIDEEYRKQEQLRHLAETDALSGLRNRRSGEEAIKERLAAGRRGFFLIMDVDDFKSINDNYGHDTGDLVITAVGDSLRRTFREKDIVFRLGGDEFAVFVSDIGPGTDTDAVAERINAEIGSIDLPELMGRRISVSVGMAYGPEGEDDSYAEIYQRADQRMYEIKRRKKGLIGPA